MTAASPLRGAEFPKSHRLRTRAEFLRVQNEGFKASTPHLLALALKNDKPVTRVGLTVSNKVGNAVVRNRIRRHLREFYRHRRSALPVGLDVVFIAKNSAAEADEKTLSAGFDLITEKLTRRFA